MNFRALLIEFDVQENRTGRAIEREEIEQVGDIDIDHISKRDHGRKTNTMRRRPFDQAGGDGAGLRSQSKSPRRGIRAAKLALSLARDDTMPRQLGPTSLRPVARAAFSQASASEPAPWPRPAVMMIAAPAPFSPANFTMPGTERGGVAITSRSGAAGSS